MSVHGRVGTHVDVEEKPLRGGGGRVLMRTERDALIPALCCSMEALSGPGARCLLNIPMRIMWVRRAGFTVCGRRTSANIYTRPDAHSRACVDVWGWKRPIRRHAGRVLMCTEWDASTAVPTMQRASQHEINKELTARFFEFSNWCSISISTSTLI